MTEEHADREVSPQNRGDDEGFDRALRPRSFQDYVGQRDLLANLRVFVAAARKRGEAVDHMLFFGPPGLGKTTLAHILAQEMGSELLVTSGPAIERKGD
ncbi:MAG: AAA family ATPase, partial [Myxococcota bacterium]|nr:AAA family ATPase [Myxococcota bacterium]